jgi:hypothetical protein
MSPGRDEGITTLRADVLADELALPSPIRHRAHPHQGFTTEAAPDLVDGAGP